MTAQLLDLGPGDVHVAGGGTPEPAKTPTSLEHLMAAPASTDMSISAAKRRSLPSGQFADPGERKYPIHDKAHADNAAARLEQQKSSMSPGKYARIKSRIKAAQKRFGEGGSDKPKKARMRGRGFTMEFTHPSGANVRVRHMSAADADGLCFLPAQAITLGED